MVRGAENCGLGRVKLLFREGKTMLREDCTIVVRDYGKL